MFTRGYCSPVADLTVGDLSGLYATRSLDCLCHGISVGMTGSEGLNPIRVRAIRSCQGLRDVLVIVICCLFDVCFLEFCS